VAASVTSRRRAALADPTGIVAGDPLDKMPVIGELTDAAIELLAALLVEGAPRESGFNSHGDQNHGKKQAKETKN
jgi:hypothetical protein